MSKEVLYLGLDVHAESIAVAIAEAGPCGFVLARFLKKKGIACDVITPSLTPKGSGDKIKTDRRDARMLARLHRAGELTAVHVPDERDEAIRDLCRARADAVQDQRSGRNQLKSLPAAQRLSLR